MASTDEARGQNTDRQPPEERKLSHDQPSEPRSEEKESPEGSEKDSVEEVGGHEKCMG